jgi:hypothetical protein
VPVKTTFEKLPRLGFSYFYPFWEEKNYIITITNMESALNGNL